MSKPTGYIVRPRDMKAMQHAVRWANAHNWDNLYEAARTLIGWAEPFVPLPLDEPVNVPADPDVEPQPYDMPSPEADALDRIAETVRVGDLWSWGERLDEIAAILRETGRLS